MNLEKKKIWNDKISNFISQIPNYAEMNPLNSGKGIVICAGVRHFISSLITVEMLIKQNENIQIEWYYVGDELIDIQKEHLLSKKNIKLINCLDILPSWFNEKIEVCHLKGFMIKPFALMMSGFEDILLIDGDNIPLCNVSELFNCKEYLEYGNVFWKDINFLSKEINENLYNYTFNFYENFDIKEQKHYGYSLAESGQILINKKKCWKALCLSYFFNYHHNFFYQIFFGDKDLYYIAFEKTNTKYYQNKHYPHGIGTEDVPLSKVNMLLQRHPTTGDYAFLHRTLSKITINKLLSPKYIYTNLDYPLYSYMDQKNMINLYAQNTIDSNICFVTAFTDIGRDKWENNSRPKEEYFEKFKNLIKITNLNLVVFIEKENYELLQETITQSNTSANIKIELFEKNDIESWKYHKDIDNILKSEKYKKLIEERDENDIETYNSDYICVDFSKVDFIKLTINKKLFNTDYYGWVDFGFMIDTKYLPENNIFTIRSLDKNFIHFTSLDYWNELSNSNRKNLIQNGKNIIPGGVFLGSMNQMLEFNNIFHKTIDSYLEENIIDDAQSLYVDIYHKYNIIKIHKNDYLIDKYSMEFFFDENNKEVCMTYTSDGHKATDGGNAFWYNSLIYFDESNEYKKEYHINDFLIKITKEIENEWNKIRVFYQNNINNILKYHQTNIQNSITLNYKNYNVVNVKELESNLCEISIYLKDNTFHFNSCLIYYIHVKKYEQFIALFAEMVNKNIDDDTSILIVEHLLSTIFNEHNFKLFFQHIKEKYRFHFLYSLHSKNLIKLPELKQLYSNNNNSFLTKFCDLLDVKNISLLEKTLDYLLVNKKEIPTFSYPIYLHHFYDVSFNDNNNIEIKRKISKLHRLLFPSLNYVNKNINHHNFNINHKIKIGFISTNFKSHSVARDRTGIITNLYKDKFETTIFYFNKFPNDLFFNKLWNSGNKNILLQGGFDNYINQIENEKLDILVYCDIGMQEQTYLLAHCRLAPIQITTWGHSETTGIDTIDYYISSLLYEKDEETSQKYYSEKIILQNSLCTYYYNEYYDLFYSLKDKDYKLPLKDKEMYLTYCQYLHKISDVDINIFTNIFKKIKNIKIVFVNGTNSQEDENKLRKRLEKYNKHFIILPSLRTGNFYDLIQKSYLMLDSYPHGGCNTSLESFYYNKIVITKPSKYLRGRFTQGFYKKMNINDCIVNNVDEYVQKVERFVKDKKYKKNIENKININKYKLYNDIDSIHEWGKTLEELYINN